MYPAELSWTSVHAAFAKMLDGILAGYPVLTVLAFVSVLTVLLWLLSRLRRFWFTVWVGAMVANAMCVIALTFGYLLTDIPPRTIIAAVLHGP